MTMAATLSVVLPLVAPPSRHLAVPAGCRIASCRPLIVPPSRQQADSSSHCSALSSSCPASWLSHCLSPSFGCATLLSTRRTRLLLHRLSSSSRCTPRCPLVLSPRRLVVVLPLDALPSHHLVISSCRLLLPCHASWLSHHHFLSSSRHTALLSSHRAGWLLRCLSLRRPLVLSS